MTPTVVPLVGGAVRWSRNTAMTDDMTGAMRELEMWLEPRLAERDGAASGLRLEAHGKPGSGFSAETTILAGTWNGPDSARTDKFVLRKETPDPPVYPTQAAGLEVEIEIQYRVMSAIAEHSDVPIAPLYGYEANPALIGAPFFVMGFVDGVVPIESPMYTLEGFFTELAPESRRTMIDDGIRQLAGIHAIDWRAASLEWLTTGVTPSTARQAEIWRTYAERELRGRLHEPLDRGWAWLDAHRPPEAPVTLCWGDPRLGNVIWRHDRAACVTDFEAASIAPAEIDLGWWLMFDRWAHETSGVDRLPGEPNRAEQTALYEQLSGRRVGDTMWYEVFAAVRYCAIVVRVMNRLVDRGVMPADHTVWIDNPVVPCLEQLLAEAG
jgi:aminoglycoside phosphotransferase (APT) family kinase protein